MGYQTPIDVKMPRLNSIKHGILHYKFIRYHLSVKIRIYPSLPHLNSISLLT